MTTAAIAIVSAGIGTYAMRASFLAMSTRLGSVGPTTRRVLRQIPPAALAAIVVPGLLRPAGEIDVLQIRPVAAIVTAIIATRTKSPGWPLLVGATVLAASWLL